MLLLPTLIILDFFFNESDAKDMVLPQDQAQIPSFTWRKEGNTGGRGWDALWEFVGEWVNCLYHPYYWPTCNHWKINCMIYDQDNPTSGTLKTVMSYVSPSHGLTRIRIIYLLAGFSVHWQDRAAMRRGMGVCVYLSITADAQCLKRKMSWGIAHLR
jgi:hypothetical protein